MKPGEKAHSKLGASIAKRWLNCPPSVAASEAAPPARETEYAAEGTLAHSWLEWVLLSEVLKHKKLPPKPKVTSEMENHVQTAVNWIEQEYSPEVGDELLVETKVDLSYIDPLMFGTLDVAIVREFGRLTVIDFKYGAGMAVDVSDDKGSPNEQLVYYALGVAKKYDFNFSDVELVVIQPRCHHEDGPIRSQVFDMRTIMSWEELFRRGAARTKDKNARRFAGDWCRFCPASQGCPAIADRALDAARAAFDDDDTVEITLEEKLPVLPHPKDLKHDVIGKILKNADALEAWIGSVRGYAHGLLERGGTVDGYKLVYKKPRRQWNDPVAAKEWAHRFIGEPAFELCSPAQAEKLLKDGKAWVKQLATPISSGLTMAKDIDPRPAVDHIKNVFSDEEGEREEESEEKGVHEKIVEAVEGVEHATKVLKGRRKKKGESQTQAQGEEDFDLGF